MSPFSALFLSILRVDMNRCALAVVAVMLSVLAATAVRAAEYNLRAAGPPPEGLAADIRKTLEGEGHRIAGPEGVLCELWLAKATAQKAGFKPDLRVKYPLEVGTLVGVLRVSKPNVFADFRDQMLLPGLYTVRYGQQPQDGNHVGTSPQADFLLALPAEDDKSAETLGDADELNAVSAEAAGSSHPAIFALLDPQEAKGNKPELRYQPVEDYWVLHVPGGEQRPALRLVVVGLGEQ
jgi:hypothetical protein